MEELTIVCKCGLREHQFSMLYEDDCLAFVVHLSSRGFFRRVWKAIKYVFGYRSKYGDWDEILVSRTEAERIRGFIGEYLYGVTPEQAATDAYFEAMRER